MLYNDSEREVMKNAIQPWLRGRTCPDGYDLELDRHLVLIEEFLPDDYFRGKRILELGPGQCDFLDIAKRKGAVATFGVDFDPAIVELGKLRGHQVTLANLSEGWPLAGQRFDGVYSRVSTNIYWYKEADRLRGFLDGIADSVAGGWLLFVPFNQPYENPQAPQLRAEADAWLKREEIELLLPDEERLQRLSIAGYGVPLHEVWFRPQPGKKSRRRRGGRPVRLDRGRQAASEMPRNGG